MKRWQNITTKDLRRVVGKLSLEQGTAKRSAHDVFWYYLDGKKTLRVTLPNVHGGSGSISTGFLDAVKNNLRVTGPQLADLVECPLSADEYRQIVRNAVSDDS
jgi:hypothetical protein